MCMQHDAESALKKARLLKDQKQEEYDRACTSTSKIEEEQLGAGGKQLEKRRRLEDEALQKVAKIILFIPTPCMV